MSKPRPSPVIRTDEDEGIDDDGDIDADIDADERVVQDG
jgi:hypothetical protein